MSLFESVMQKYGVKCDNYEKPDILSINSQGFAELMECVVLCGDYTNLYKQYIEALARDESWYFYGMKVKINNRLNNDVFFMYKEDKQ